jgi:hypothetical protein
MPNVIDQLSGPTPQKLSLEGNPGPTFETEGQRATSNIQGLSRNGVLQSSQGLIAGRRYGIGRFSVFVNPSEPPVSAPDNFVANPYYPSLGGTYKNKGPREGRY